MKVVMITGNGGSGGLIGYIKGLLSADIYDDCELILFCGNDLYEKIRNLKTFVRVITTPLCKERGWDIVKNKTLPKQLIQMIEQEEPDIVLFLNGYIRRGLESIPNVMILHNQLFVDSYQLLRHGFTKLTLKLLAFRYAVRRSMKTANGVIFLSKFSKRQADEKSLKYQNGVVIPFGFEKENMVNEIPHTTKCNKIKFIYISAMLPYKNHLNLVEACNLLKKAGKEFELHIVGTKYKPIYKKIVKKLSKYGLKDNVIFYDWVEHKKIKTLIDQSDVFIYASSIETTGYGLLEGMARGSLIATSNQAGFSALLKDGGVYFNPQNICSIKDALFSVIEMEEVSRNSLKQKALSYAGQYSWDKSAKQHCEYFKEIITHCSCL